MPIAITREVSPSIARCELTHLAREPIDIARAVAQHESYVRALEDLGCTIVQASPQPELPDAVFVEDAAVVVGEIAVITRPGAESRRGETASIAGLLARYRPVATIDEPGTLDGGDVLRIGRQLFVGVSERTNRDAIRQLERHLAPFGYRVTPVDVAGCLHLKSAVTQLAESAVLLNPDWIDARAFADFETVAIDRAEPYAANVLTIGPVALCASAFPRTREAIERRGIETRSVDVSELAKAEGALTCCSIVFEA